MSNLTESVASLQTAVDDVAVRFNDQLTPLQQALSDAQAALEAAHIEDEAQNQAIADALAAADAAASEINNQVTELNALGANPDVPVGEPTVEG